MAVLWVRSRWVADHWHYAGDRDIVCIADNGRVEILWQDRFAGRIDDPVDAQRMFDRYLHKPYDSGRPNPSADAFRRLAGRRVPAAADRRWSHFQTGAYGTPFFTNWCAGIAWDLPDVPVGPTDGTLSFPSGDPARPVLDTDSGIERAILLPAWLLLAVVAVPAATWIAVVVGRRATNGRPPGHCRRCGYDLRASPDRCPECGRAANPGGAGG